MSSTNFTNFGINFILYVISGKKFGSDLIKLFNCNKENIPLASLSMGQNTKVSVIDSHSDKSK